MAARPQNTGQGEVTSSFREYPSATSSSRSTDLSVMGILRAAALALALVISGANAQIDGSDLCSCSPTVFDFTLNFAAACPGNLEADDGINDLSCFTTVVSEDRENTQPVVIDTVTILELNNDAVINSTTLRGPFMDGDVIEYASISSYENLTSTYFPFGLQMTLTGENSDGATVINAVAVEYTNDCEAWPVFPDGATIGWVDISTVEDALEQYCPAVPSAPTPAETSDPTTAPVETSVPTDAPPTDAPPTDSAPTDALPTDSAPTDAPPTDSAPTDAPPTDSAPTDTPPTDGPAPTDSSPTDSPPTDGPAPTDSPPTDGPAPTDSPPTDPPPTDGPAPTDSPPTDGPAPTDSSPTDSPPTDGPAPTDSPPTDGPAPTDSSPTGSPPTDGPPPTDSPPTDGPPPTDSPPTDGPPPTADPPSPTADPPSPTTPKPPSPTPKPPTPFPDMSMSYSMSLSMSMSFYYGDVRMLLDEEDLFDFGTFEEEEEEVFEFGRRHDLLRRKR